MYTTAQLHAIRATAERKLAFAGGMIPLARTESERLYYKQCAERVASFYRHAIIDATMLLDGLDEDDCAAGLDQALREDCDLNSAYVDAAIIERRAAA